jgi:hypothetical protein
VKLELGQLRAHKLRILDFDIENRPLSYWIPDRPTAEVTAIAWSWIGSSAVHCALLKPDESSMHEMLSDFREVYDQADIVTGHYIRRHDLPILNGAMVENGLLPLDTKLTSDTKLDLINWKDLPQSQEYLSSMYGLSRPKHHMSQHEWREANRLTEAGIRATYERVTKDVRQHKQLRAHLVEAEALGPPQLWRP